MSVVERPRARSVGDIGRTLRRISRAAGPDVYRDDTATEPTHLWTYGPGDYEAAALERVVNEGRAANRHVDYADNFGRAGGDTTFRVTGPAGQAATLTVLPGTTVTVDGRPLPDDAVLRLPGTTGRAQVQVRLVSPPGCPAAVGIELAAGAVLEWTRKDHSGRDLDVAPRPGGLTPPHAVGEPEFDVDLDAIGAGLYAAPAPVLGRVVLSEVTGTPALRTGESLDEACADADHAESRHDLVRLPDRAVSAHRLGFRYARVSGGSAGRVQARASLRPVHRRGAFATSDPALTSMWAVSAFTLRSCLQTFLVDGIKRDRMPWAGDSALGVLTTAYAFADPGVLRDTLVALGRPLGGYVNGIADYSLWWIIAHGLYQRHFADETFLRAQAPHIVAMINALARHAPDDDGLLRTGDVAGQFAHAGPGGFFLDWGVRWEQGRTLTAVQVLWFWAVRTAAELLGRVDQDSAGRWARLADRIADTLRVRAWDADAQRWSAWLDDPTPSAYPNFLAPLAGLHAEGTSPSAAMVSAIVDDEAGTPFMRAFALLGLARLGAADRALEGLRTMWGGMQDAGATTFWEEFGDAAASPWEMYGRPFGKSLTHAWSAGPAAALPRVVLGLEPLSDGWERFAVAPQLGSLEWAGAVVPTPHGDIEVVVDQTSLTAHFPPGVTMLVRGRAFDHPVVVRLADL